ncbi:MAG TPA: carbamoyl phosphate synthase small subunit, partial [Desulfobacteraceae bacterium]|nr:carbamoyl phosphate synthase small subunit [Desulfobacteraceae bacterium]
MKALIGLEDGTVLTGESFTGSGEATGEIVFNTSMSGYQEVLTDPSYTAQLVTMTYPLIGNYGVNEEDMESSSVHPRAFLMREYQAIPSNYRATATLAEFLQRFNVLGITGIDTRMLTRIIRTRGAMKAVISTEDLDGDSLVRRAREWPGLIGRDMVERVTSATPYRWTENGPVDGYGFG